MHRLCLLLIYEGMLFNGFVSWKDFPFDLLFAEADHNMDPTKSQAPNVSFQVCPLSLRSNMALASKPKQQINSDGGGTKGVGNSAKQEKSKTSRRK